MVSTVDSLKTRHCVNLVIIAFFSLYFILMWANVRFRSQEWPPNDLEACAGPICGGLRAIFLSMALQCTLFMGSGLMTVGIWGYPCQHLEPLFTAVAPSHLSREATQSSGVSTHSASQAMGLSNNLEGAPSENA